MDAMGLAQLKRQMEWYAEAIRHSERDLQSAELALEGEKHKVEELRKKLKENKQRHETFKVDVAKGEEEVRRKTFQQHR